MQNDLMQFQMVTDNCPQITRYNFCFYEFTEFLLTPFYTFSLKKNNFLVLSTHTVSKRNTLPLLKLCLEGLMKRIWDSEKDPKFLNNVSRGPKKPTGRLSGSPHLSSLMILYQPVLLTSQKLSHAMDSPHTLRTPWLPEIPIYGFRRFLIQGQCFPGFT